MSVCIKGCVYVHARTHTYGRACSVCVEKGSKGARALSDPVENKQTDTGTNRHTNTDTDTDTDTDANTDKDTHRHRHRRRHRHRHRHRHTHHRQQPGYNSPWVEPFWPPPRDRLALASRKAQSRAFRDQTVLRDYTVLRDSAVLRDFAVVRYNTWQNLNLVQFGPHFPRHEHSFVHLS